MVSFTYQGLDLKIVMIEAGFKMSGGRGLAVVPRVALGGAPLAARAGRVAPPRLHVRVVRAALPPLVRVHHRAHTAEEVRVYELTRTLPLEI